MTDNLYAPPKADLTKPSEKGEPYLNGFDRPMVIAAILLVIVSILITVVFYTYDPTSFVLVNEIVSVVIGIALTIFTLYFVKRLRVVGLGTALENAGKPLGILGYFWRTFLIETVGAIALMVVLVVILMLSGVDPDEFFNSLMGIIIISLLLFPVYLFCTWAFFSRDRSGQLNGFFKMFRGY